MKKSTKLFAFILGTTLIFGGLAAVASMKQNNIKEVKAETEVNSTIKCIYGDVWNNRVFNDKCNSILFRYDGVAHGDSSQTTYKDSEILSKVLFNGVELNNYPDAAIVTWPDAQYFYIVYPKADLVDGSAIEILEGLTVGNAVFHGDYKLTFDASLERWDRTFTSAVNATFNKIFDGNELYNTATQILIVYNDAPAISDVAVTNAEELKNWNKYVLYNGNPISNLSGVQLRAWTGTAMRWFHIIFPTATAGDVLTIVEGCQFSAATFEQMRFVFDGTKWSKKNLVEEDSLVKNGDYQLFTISDYNLTGNDSVPFFGDVGTACCDSFGFQFNVNIEAENLATTTLNIAFGATDIYGNNPFIKLCLNDPTFKFGFYLNGAYDWTGHSKNPEWTAGEHLYEFYAIKSDSTHIICILGVDGVLIYKSSALDISAVDFTGHTFVSTTNAGSTKLKAPFTSADTVEKALNRFVERKLNSKGATYSSAANYIKTYLTSTQKEAFNTSDSYAEARAKLYQLEVSNAIALIDAIGEVDLSKENAISAARSAYNDLSDNSKNAVSNYKTLEDAEARLAELKDAKSEAEDVDALIDAIGEVDLSKEEAINAARSAYNALNDEAKGFVNGLTTLEAAEARLAELKTAKSEAEALDNSIANIGEVTLEKEETINTIRANYDALSEDAKGFVTGLTTLEAAEARLVELKDAKSEAEDVDALIDAIGEVDLSKEEAINAARSAYETLNDDAKEFVTKLSVLEAAEATYKQLKDQDDASKVDELIEAIGEVDLSKEEAINAAETAYLALNDDAKALVTNIEVLNDAKARIAELKTAKSEAEALDNSIANIGEVTLEKENTINEIRADYDALSDDAKGFVTGLTTLEAAEARLAELKDANEAAKNVDALIKAIGEITGTADNLDNIITARNAYEALSEKAKTFVTKLSNLEAAEATFNSKLNTAKNAALNHVDEFLESLDLNRYSEENKQLISDKTDAIKVSINAQTSIDNLDSLVDTYMSEVNGIPHVAKTGCGGNIITSSILLSTLALMTVAGILIAKKRKEA